MLDHLGFGFVEVGSISARLSVGNPKPRLFRLPNDRAIIVNYGLPNDGAEPFDFVHGFIFNLPTGKPQTLRITTPQAIWNTMPGAVAGKPVDEVEF